MRDGAGLLLHARDPDPGDMRRPLFHLVRTTEGNRWALSARLSGKQRASLEAAFRGEPTVPALTALEASASLSGAALESILGSPALIDEHRGTAFTFPEVLTPPASEIELVNDPRWLATVPQLAWVREATAAAHPLCVARNSMGEVVAVCHSSRSIPNAAVAGVETAEAFRGRGLGIAVVAGWAAAVRAEGRQPFYGTSWSNAASLGIARRLGLVMFGEDYHLG
ncbi:MAG: GNAT family N-acetyltransferase [Dehalococcoidia bacterium]|nr:GNAT family N-acetyltransferase [Dehalococcoidia bacterium]